MFNENILVGYDTSDDACVYKVTDDIAIVQTVDFFPPMVDDPYMFGQIAAANALSDIYAMGARPTHAMNLLCFPNCLGLDVASEILRGGADKAIEAGCAITGGHTITDNEPKYGLCVNGIVNPNDVLLNSAARPGDVLILTKPLGTGILTTAHKGGMISEENFEVAVKCMATLNRYAAEAAEGLNVHACTDITGFGLAGHLCEMAKGGNVTVLLYPDNIPVLPEAIEMAMMGLVPGGAYRNRDFFGPDTDLTDVSTELADVIFDPQTSGGLLFAVDGNDTEKLIENLSAAGICAAKIGVVVEYSGVSLKTYTA